MFLSLLNSADRSFGRRFTMSSLASTFHDTAVPPKAYSHALTALTDDAGVAGVALTILNKSTGNVDEVCFSGLSAGRKSDYVRHYAAGDPYSPLLDRSWKKLSDCLPDSSVPLKQAAPRHVERFSSSRTRIFNESQTRVLAKGSRFYFHVDSSIRYPDETGSVFPLRGGRAHALVLAQELAQDETLARVLQFRYR